MGKLIDLTGLRFGRLVVICRSEPLPTDRGKVYWDCVCDCGNKNRTEGYLLRNGIVQSCGCLHREAITKHGGINDRLYKIWRAMKSRCKNSNDRAYKYYGGKGITVCSEWEEYPQFKKWAFENGYNEELTIDRVDSNKGYCPENCRWISKSENSKRTAKNYLTVYGVTKSYKEWERCIGVGDMCIEHWVERRGENYAIKRIDATIHPDKYTPEEIEELGIHKNKRRYVTINGETLSFSGWAKRIGMTHTGVLYWVNQYGEEYAIERIKSAIMGE